MSASVGRAALTFSALFTAAVAKTLSSVVDVSGEQYGKPSSLLSRGPLWLICSFNVSPLYCARTRALCLITASSSSAKTSRWLETICSMF